PGEVAVARATDVLEQLVELLVGPGAGDGGDGRLVVELSVGLGIAHHPSIAPPSNSVASGLVRPQASGDSGTPEAATEAITPRRRSACPDARSARSTNAETEPGRSCLVDRSASRWYSEARSSRARTAAHSACSTCWWWASTKLDSDHR